MLFIFVLQHIHKHLHPYFRSILSLLRNDLLSVYVVASNGRMFFFFFSFFSFDFHFAFYVGKTHFTLKKKNLSKFSSQNNFLKIMKFFHQRNHQYGMHETLMMVRIVKYVLL
jgi:hypothetical protein